MIIEVRLLYMIKLAEFLGSEGSLGDMTFRNQKMMPFRNAIIREIIDDQLPVSERNKDRVLTEWTGSIRFSLLFKRIVSRLCGFAP